VRGDQPHVTESDPGVLGDGVVGLRGGLEVPNAVG
jgi:hypothetical protein